MQIEIQCYVGLTRTLQSLNPRDEPLNPNIKLKEEMHVMTLQLFIKKK